jgi:hypothetical protein
MCTGGRNDGRFFRRKFVARRRCRSLQLAHSFLEIRSVQ